MSAPGTFLFTFDVELIWGLFFDRRWRRRAEVRYGAVREVFPEILAALERHDIRATFAFVGHLFLDRCDGHPDMVRPEHSPFDGDWYDFDPKTDLQTDPLWYGRDLVEAVRGARPEHEIGAHGFSHALFSGSAELARSELDAAAAAARELGIEARSFVFPCNVVGHAAELAAHGFTSYRAGGEERSARLLRRLFGGSPAVGRPREVDGVVEVPTSVPMLPAMGLRRLVPLSARLAEVRKGLRRAAREGACFHLWTHPHNFVEGRETMLRYLDGALALVAEHRDGGRIEVRTMSEVRP